MSSDKLIDGLKFAFMGTLDAHKGRWGAFTDVMYLDVGGSKSNTRDWSIGNIGLPASTSADLQLDLKGLVWTLAGEYRFADDRQWTVDVLAGARQFALKPKLSWTIAGDLGPIPVGSRSGSQEIHADKWDGIVGIKGRYAFGDGNRWSVPFYADVGGGDSKVTWQAAAGIGYAFSWGDLVGMYRYLGYDFKSGNPIHRMTFSGPMVGAVFRW